MARRAGRQLPTVAWSGETFDLEEIGAQRTSAISIPEIGYWAARIDDADKAVPQRIWTTEIGLAQTTDGSTLLGARLLCVVRGDDVPFDRSIPSFVRDIVDTTYAEFDGRQASSSPALAETEQDVEELVSLVSDPSRLSDVVVFSLPDGSTDPTRTAASADDVATKTVGAAHVFIITGPASFFLSDRVGKEFSVFRQAVRTYRPGFNSTEDEPFNHPLGFPERIATWPNGGPSGYQKLLISQALIRSVTARDSEQRLPSFVNVRRTAAELRSQSAKEAGSSDTDLLKLADQEIESLKGGLAEERNTYDGLLRVAEDERQQAIEEVEQIKATNRHLRLRIDALHAEITRSGGRPPSDDIPTNLEGFEHWCSKNLAGAVEMHNRAYQGIKKSELEDISLIYQSLLLLRDQYVPMRRSGGRDLKSGYDTTSRKLGLEESATFAGARAGEHGETYFIKYAGQRRLLDRHLKKGSSREARHCFRLYFFWDDTEEVAVVGWLPSHLDTRTT